jgi:hypothetical protein
MIVTPVKKGTLEYLYLEDFYTQAQLEQVQAELEDLAPLAQDPAVLLSAQDEKGPMRTGHGLFLNKYYYHKNSYSSILDINRQVFSEPVLAAGRGLSIHWEHLRRSNADATMVNFYSNGEEYRPHRDSCVFTALVFMGIGSFEGGDFELVDYELRIPFAHNTGIIIPGCASHQAHAITCEPGNYRVSIANFINYVS